jgi:hypothetical protein
MFQHLNSTNVVRTSGIEARTADMLEKLSFGEDDFDFCVKQNLVEKFEIIFTTKPNKIFWSV